jgi:alpha-mannosidase II
LFEFSKKTTAWGGNIVPIDASNLKSKASLLLDQYRKKSTLYRSKSVLIPLGDDFTYGSSAYVNEMFGNHQKLQDYINGADSLNANVKWSNLSNYFKSVSTRTKSANIGLPVLTGDFYTYADRVDDYW